MKRSRFTQFGTDDILEAFGEKQVPCPNPDCPEDAVIDAQAIIACCPRPGADGRYQTTECCGLDRDQLFELVDPEPDREPMEDAYQFEVNA